MRSSSPKTPAESRNLRISQASLGESPFEDRSEPSKVIETGFCLRGFLARNFGAFFSRFGESNGDGLLAAGYGATFAAAT